MVAEERKGERKGEGEREERRERGPDAKGGWGWRGRGAEGACVLPLTRRGGGDTGRLLALMKRLRNRLDAEDGEAGGELDLT